MARYWNGISDGLSWTGKMGLLCRHLCLCKTSAVILLASLCGCAPMRNDAKPYPEIAPEQIRLADGIRLARDGWPSARWWTGYNDAQLNALIEQGLAASPTMTIAKTRVAQTRSQVEIVRAGVDFPLVLFGAIDQEHVSSKGFLGAYAGKQPSIGADGPWYTEGIVGLGTNMNIDLFGQRRSQVDAAMGAENARIAEVSAVELEVATDVAQLYFESQTTFATIELLQQSHEVASFAVEAHRARYARGLESAVPAQDAIAQQLALERQIAAARARIIQLREALRALVGAGPDELADIKQVALPVVEPGLPATLSYELLTRRPDLQALRWYVQSSFDRIDAAKAAFYPSFNIRAFFGFNALHLEDLFNSDSKQINITPGLSLPLFDSGRLNANLDSARSASNVLISQYNQAVLNAIRDVARAGSRMQDLQEEVRLQERRVQATEFSRDSASARYERGLSNKLIAMQAHQPVIVERLALLDLNARRLSQDIALIKALGGGYRNETPLTLPPR
jgi:multidrug efflux system outer membrane protein